MCRLKSATYLCLVLMMLGLTACGPAPAPAEEPAPAAPAEEPAPAAPAEEPAPDELPTCETVVLWPEEELCREDIDSSFLVSVDFGEPTQVEEEWVSGVRYENQQGEAFFITVAGAESSSVITFTKQLRVCFDLIKLPCRVDAQPEGDIESEPLSGEDLAINFYPEIPEDPSAAYVVDFVIDPGISKNARHSYSSKYAWKAWVRISVVYGSGEVIAGLCRNSPMPLVTTQVAYSGSQTDSLSDEASYYARYAAGVRGIASSSRYRISGRSGYVGWYAGYYDPPPGPQKLWKQCLP